MVKKAFIAVILTVFLCGCSAGPVKKSEFMLDTVCTITVYDKDDAPYIDEAFEVCRHYESLLSRTIPTSDIGRINSSGGASVTVSSETAELIKKGIYYGELSGGRFDISIAPVSSLWDFKSGSAEVPDNGKIKEALKAVDYRKIRVEGNTVTLIEPGMGLDLGGIAKGYIADKAAEKLKERGVKRAIVDLGGNIVAVGSKNGQPFRVGIRKPFSESGEVLTTVSVKDKSVVTSGIYERYFEKDGKIYHHILDTKTGYPVENSLASATVICPSSADADALSTTLFILGAEEGSALAKKLGIEAIFIDRNNNIIRSTD